LISVTPEILRNQHQVFENTAEALRVHLIGDWYNTTFTKQDANEALEIVKKYSSSIPDTLGVLYPDFEWIPWRFNKTKEGFLDIKANRISLINAIARDFGIKELGGWYDISTEDFARANGGTLLNKYNHSLYNLMQSNFSKHNWEAWRFKNAPQRYWDSIDNQRMRFDKLGREKGVKILLDWVKVPSEILAKAECGVGTIVNHKYGGNIDKALEKMYPGHDWRSLRSANKNASLSLQEKNGLHYRALLDDIGSRLNIRILSDWYDKSSWKVVQKYGGYHLRRRYSSMRDVLKVAYPEYTWYDSQYPVKHNFWGKWNNVRRYIRELELSLNISNPRDWCRVSYQQLCDYKGRTFTILMPKLLKRYYPELDWSLDDFSNERNKRSIQRILKVRSKHLFL